MTAAKRPALRWIAVAAGVAAGALAVYASTERGRLELEFLYRSRLAPELSAATLEIEAAPGLRMFLQPDDTIITQVLLRWAQWEPMETRWFSRLLREGDRFVDVGANVGYFTLLAARLVGDEGRVYAFEPDPVAFAVLEKNVRLNRLENVVLEQKAASNEAGTLQLFLAPENKGDHRIYQTAEGRTAIDVEAVALDAYFGERVPELDFVKVDTQGAEGVILAGMQEILAQPGILLAVEFWPEALADMGFDAAEFLGGLRAHDFLFYDLGPGPELLPQLRALDESELLERHTVENGEFTNLLLVKGWTEMQRRVEDFRRSRDRMLVRSEQLAEERRAWEARLRERGANALPAPVAEALALDAEARSEEQRRALDIHFLGSTPLLEEERQGMQRARLRIEAHRAELFERRGAGASTR